MAGSLSVTELRERLGSLGLETRGRRNELQTRLRKRAQKVEQEKRPGAGPDGRDEKGGIGVQRTSRPGKASDLAPWNPRIHSYLVLDVEATCERGRQNASQRSGFDYPNEIIELPVVLLQWRKVRRRRDDECEDQGAEHFELYESDVFHTLVRPTWRPQLSSFCKALTSVTQASIDAAPTFDQVVLKLADFLRRNGLLEEGTSVTNGEKGRASKAVGTLSSKGRSGNILCAPLKPGVCWVTHGPFDLLHFVVKQSYISKLSIGVPHFLRGPLVDVKISTVKLLQAQGSDAFAEDAGAASHQDTLPTEALPSPVSSAPATRKPGRDTTIEGLLRVLDLGDFEGTQHVGIDDTRNVARIFAELARRVAVASAPVPSADGAAVSNCRRLESLALLPNTNTRNSHQRRWAWMNGKEHGQIQWDHPPEDSEKEQNVHECVL